MEKKLGKLFDMQHYEQDEALESVIDETLGQYGTALEDDDLFMVAAARGLNLLSGDKEAYERIKLKLLHSLK